MDYMTIVWALAILGGLGIVLGLGLGIASKKLAVKVDERVTQVREYLPGANCGGCGYPGCDGMAAAIVAGTAEPTSCSACSAENLQKIGEIMGIQVDASEKKVARLLCRGASQYCGLSAAYDGLMDCKAAAMVAGGYKNCKFACLGFGSCTKVCSFGAISIGPDGIPVIDENLCTGCGKCTETCPVSALKILPVTQTTYVTCHNVEFGKKVMSVCSGGCIGCKMCAKVCEAGAITIENNLPVIDAAKCTGCGKCAKACRPGALRFIGETEETTETEKEA